MNDCSRHYSGQWPTLIEARQTIPRQLLFPASQWWHKVSFHASEPASLLFVKWTGKLFFVPCHVVIPLLICYSALKCYSLLSPHLPIRTFLNPTSSSGFPVASLLFSDLPI